MELTFVFAPLARATILRSVMSDFNRRMEETSARVNKTVSNAAERLEKESADLISYLNREVVPAVRNQSSKALRIAAEKLRSFADFMDEHKNTDETKKP
jgi:acyl-CoA reductase-like NAD-dependent aldehyde dehydrogenase